MSTLLYGQSLEFWADKLREAGCEVKLPYEEPFINVGDIVRAAPVEAPEDEWMYVGGNTFVSTNSRPFFRQFLKRNELPSELQVVSVTYRFTEEA